MAEQSVRIAKIAAVVNAALLLLLVAIFIAIAWPIAVHLLQAIAIGLLVCSTDEFSFENITVEAADMLRPFERNR